MATLEDKMSMGQKIQFLRQEKNYTRKELGKISGTSETTVKQYETGKRHPRIEHLQKIADALEVDIVVFFGGDTERAKQDKPDTWEISAETAIQDFELLEDFHSLDKESQKLIRGLITKLMEKQDN